MAHTHRGPADRQSYHCCLSSEVVEADNILVWFGGIRCVLGQSLCVCDKGRRQTKIVFMFSPFWQPRETHHVDSA